MKFREKLHKESKDYDDWLRLVKEARENGKWIDNPGENPDKHLDLEKKDKNVA